MRSTNKIFSSMAIGYLLISSPAQAAFLNSIFYCQTDAQWKDEKMKPTSLTVGGYGCLMTCLAMVFQVTPKDLNTYLSDSGGYDQNGNLKHDVAAKYANGRVKLSYTGQSTLPSSPASIARGMDRDAVYFARSTRADQHWVLVKYADNGVAYYVDPLDATQTYRKVGDQFVKFGASVRIYRIVK